MVVRQHLEDALARDDAVTMTAMYNLVEKLRANEELTIKERQIHEIAACGVLRDLHDDLDQAVAECYGWPWPLAEGAILEALVVLHDERKAEEEIGKVRWLRPEYQTLRFAPGELAEQTTAFPELAAESVESREKVDWPSSAIDQIAALKSAVLKAPGDVEEIASRFRGARRALVERHLETLTILAEVRLTEDGRFHAAEQPANL